MRLSFKITIAHFFFFRKIPAKKNYVMLTKRLRVYTVCKICITETSAVKSCNLVQKAGDKFTKLSKIGFSMERFTAYFLRFFTKKDQNLAFGWTAGYLPSNPSISGIFLKFPKS